MWPASHAGPLPPNTTMVKSSSGSVSPSLCRGSRTRLGLLLLSGLLVGTALLAWRADKRQLSLTQTRRQGVSIKSNALSDTLGSDTAAGARETHQSFTPKVDNDDSLDE
jgi:hypothetical protein